VNAFRACLAAFALTLSVAMSAQAAAATEDRAPSEVVERKLAGHYYLEGIMETGSELRLDENGRFQWYFTYGALDLAADGRWHREGGSVVLLPEHSSSHRNIPKPNSNACNCASMAPILFPHGRGKRAPSAAVTC
jgi:hypothetical protein